MKKRLFLGVLGFIILISMSILIAQENINDSTTTTLLKTNIDETNQDINSFLDAPLQMTLAWQGFFRVLFRLEDGVSLRSLGVLILLWVLLLVLIFMILKEVPFFGSIAMSFSISFLVTCLISISGAISKSTKYIFTFGFFIGFGIIIIVFFILSLIIKIVKKKAIIGNAEMSGHKAGAGAKVLGKALDELSEDKEK